jgi:PiT family inorganic phosphate transporter
MFDLELSYSVLLVVCLVAACGFEFVNGFHDTANAVATVIYTNSLRPWVAVVWSGICNFLGVMFSGITVAVGIINLLPVESLVDQNIVHGLSMVMALLLSAIFWNLLTWYYGIPCSSSHTLIASILGVGIAYALLPGSGQAAVEWSQAKKIGLSLLISPLIGFTMTIIAMLVLRVFTRKNNQGEFLFREPRKDTPPPAWIRGTLILTSTAVSFSHGSNDGQKGVGLVMLILIGIVPGYFALNALQKPADFSASNRKVELLLTKIYPEPLADSDQKNLAQALALARDLQPRLSRASMAEVPKAERFTIRKDIMLLDRKVKNILASADVRISAQDRLQLTRETKNLRRLIDYAPHWVIVMIALSIGIGTMVGWKRIVKTIGEKIGKEHLTYAQGASSEFVAAGTIGLSSLYGWPVSTTQVLSSGIAGSMVANKGVKNLQIETVRNILMAWFLTLPVVMILSGTLFLLFRSIF